MTSRMYSSSDSDSETLNQVISIDNSDATMTRASEGRQQNPGPGSRSQSKTLTLDPPQYLDEENPTPQSDSKKAKSDDFPARSPRGSAIRTFHRRGPKRKKIGPKKRAALAKISEHRLRIQRETLRPIAFKPFQDLDFDSHEELLRSLNLWDFVHIDFDQHLRTDLLAELISSYDSGVRGSYLNEVKIMVNRADLARALKLPSKVMVKKGDGAEESPPASEESISFIQEFVSNWMLLHEDMWLMPTEIYNWNKAIKEGHFSKVDWAGIIWFMVDKELAKAPNLRDCYYASHLQCLIRSQREELLKVKEHGPPVDLDEMEDEPVDLEVKEEEEEEGGNADPKVVEADDFSGQNIELCLGQENVDRADVAEDNVDRADDVGQENLEEVGVEKEQGGVEDDMDFEECKLEEPGQWLFDGNGNISEPCLQRCKQREVKSLDFGEERNKDVEVGGVEEEGNEDDEEEEAMEQDGAFHLSLTGMHSEGLASGSLIQAMEAAQIPQSSGMTMRDQFAGEFLSPRDDGRMLAGSSSIFGSGIKRELMHENADSQYPHNGNKRLRIDGPWVGKSSGEIDNCWEQIHHWTEKARMVAVEKEQALEQTMVDQQILLNGLQQRDEVIDHLQKEAEEQNKRQMEVYRLERELIVMGNILDWYRKALKDTQKSFAEYRARRPQPDADEPLYRDVPGSGGLVLSVMELEKRRLKKEEEDRMNRLMIEMKIKDFEAGWSSTFEAYNQNVESLSNRLPEIEANVNLLKEGIASRRIPKIPESAPNENERTL